MRRLGAGGVEADGLAGGGDGRLLLLERLALEVLEGGQGELEFAGEFLLGDLLGWLCATRLSLTTV